MGQLIKETKYIYIYSIDNMYTVVYTLYRLYITYSRTRRWRKFQKGKIYNSEEHVPIESFVTILID